MKQIINSSLASLIVISLFLIYSQKHAIISAPSTNIKDTLSSSALSYFGRMAVGTSAGDNLVKIATSGNPSNSTANIFVGETLAIGNTSTPGSTTYFIKDIGNTALMELTTGLGSSNSYTGAYIVATSSAIHTITFTPASSVANGIWQFLIKASSNSNENSADGMPDQGGFDLGATTPTSTGPSGLGMRLLAADITCPFGAASVGTTVVLTSPSVGVGSTGSYHVVTCTLSAGATNTVGSPVTWTIGRSLATGAQLINPSAATTGHVEGTADTYTFFIRHALSDGTIIDVDTSVGKIAVLEGVRVSATVDPTITFFIDAPAAVGVGQRRCGQLLTTGASNTTSTVVNFGPLALSSFNDVAQRFNATTNAKNGYVVQVYQDMPLTNVNTGVTIPNGHCDTATPCTMTTAATWTLDNGSTSSQFGYSLEVGVTSSGTTLGIGATNSQFKAFGSGYANAQTIMSRTTAPAITESAYICYRATASNYQEAGSYENSLTFVATATF